jgi:hypothetical protein
VDLALAAAWFALGKLSSAQAINAASAALDRGVYSETLGELMSADPVGLSAVPMFGQALAELGIPVPPLCEARRVIAREYARRIVVGKMTPFDGAWRIGWDAADCPDADPDLLAFMGLASQWDDSPRVRPEIEAHILDDAQRLLAGDQQTKPSATADSNA